MVAITQRSVGGRRHGARWCRALPASLAEFQRGYHYRCTPCVAHPDQPNAQVRRRGCLSAAGQLGRSVSGGLSGDSDTGKGALGFEAAWQLRRTASLW
eukprot:395338-Pleurochrysis_carterae.AAC.2